MHVVCLRSVQSAPGPVGGAGLLPPSPGGGPYKQYRVTVPCANRLCDLYTNYTAVMQFAFFAFNKLVCKLAVGPKTAGEFHANEAPARLRYGAGSRIKISLK